MEDGRLLLAAGALLVAALAASLAAGRVRVPGLLLVLAVGMALGSDVLGLIEFSDYQLAQDIGVVALALILYEGGLASGFEEIRPVLRPVLGLATVGTLVTALVAGGGAALLFDLTLLQGLLLGAIVASTDGAAVFAVLRGSTLRRRIARTLEGEAGMNDPVAILLVVGFIAWIEEPGYGIVDMLVLMVEEIGIGAICGLAVGAGGAKALTRVKLASAGLYPVASLAIAATAFGLAAVLHGSGFLAVYLAGLAIGSSSSPARRTIVAFHDGMAWVAQLVLFLSLGLLVFPSQLPEVALRGIALALIVVFVARPIGVRIGLLGAGFSLQERLALSWAGLRGGVPVVLATFPVLEGVEGAATFFNIVFFAVLFSTLLQGTTFEAVARRLGVTTDEAALPATLLDPVTVRRLGAEVIEFIVAPDHVVDGRRVRDLGLPREALLNVIVRGDQAIPPRGSTRIVAGDRLSVLVRQEVAVEFAQLTELWRTGPMQGQIVKRPRPTSLIFSERPWTAADGDAARPKTVNGIDVLERVRTRRDKPGAVVTLADGRCAWTGKTIAVGTPQQLQQAARRRLARSPDDADQAWWREVLGALATP